MGNPWAMADAVAAHVESVDDGGRYWEPTSTGDGQEITLEAHDGSTMTVTYTENDDGTWTLHDGTVTDA